MYPASSAGLVRKDSYFHIGYATELYFISCDFSVLLIILVVKFLDLKNRMLLSVLQIFLESFFCNVLQLIRNSYLKSTLINKALKNPMTMFQMLQSLHILVWCLLLLRFSLSHLEVEEVAETSSHTEHSATGWSICGT